MARREKGTHKNGVVVGSNFRGVSRLGRLNRSLKLLLLVVAVVVVGLALWQLTTRSNQQPDQTVKQLTTEQFYTQQTKKIAATPLPESASAEDKYNRAYSLADMYYQTNNYKEAKSYFDQAVTQSASITVSVHDLFVLGAKIDAKLGDRQTARALLAKAQAYDEALTDGTSKAVNLGEIAQVKQEFGL